MTLEMKTLPLSHHVDCAALVKAVDQTHIFGVSETNPKGLRNTPTCRIHAI